VTRTPSGPAGPNPRGCSRAGASEKASPSSAFDLEVHRAAPTRPSADCRRETRARPRYHEAVKCSFCGKTHDEVKRLIAGPSVYICDECVMLCVDVVEEQASVETAGTGRVIARRAKERLLVRLPDGSVHVCDQITEWEPFRHDGILFEWCRAEGSVRAKTKLAVVCVRRSGRAGPTLGAAFAANLEPTSEHAKTVAARFTETEKALDQIAIEAQPSPWIAEELVAFLHPNGRRALGRIAVAAPFVVDGLEARCRVALDGLETLSPVSGASPLQALMLAVQLLGKRLHAFRARGGRIVERVGDEDVAIEATFGPLLVE